MTTDGHVVTLTPEQRAVVLVLVGQAIADSYGGDESEADMREEDRALLVSIQRALNRGH